MTRYRNGDAFTSTQVYYERVNSHTAGCAFNFTNCGFKDVTKIVTGLEDYPATKIRFSKSFSFLHPDAKCEYEDQRNQFFLENERRDDYMETREGLDLLNVNFKEYMIAFKDPDHLPWYVSNVVFWLASFFLLSWPLRVVIEYKTAYIHFHVHKVFGTNYVPTERQPSTYMTRTNTIGSTDLEMIVRNNFTIVPSYSEALLMNENATSSRTLHDANANITSPVLGPTRSITWNNISQSASSGYISGFFSSSNVAGVFHSNSLDIDENGQGQVARRSFHSSLRNMLRSPWSRRRKNISKAVRSKTMFMLSSPGSADEYSLSSNNQPLSAQSSRNYSSFNDINSPGSRRYVALSNDVDRQSRQASSEPDKRHVLSDVSASGSARENVPLLPTMLTINEVRTPKKAKSGTTDDDNAIKPNRPCSFLNATCRLAKDGEAVPCKTFFVKSNLPKVPISSILSESNHSLQTDVNTPSSPPSYEEALHMRNPGALKHWRPSSGQSESQVLFPNGHRSTAAHYDTMMETSL